LNKPSVTVLFGTVDGGYSDSSSEQPMVNTCSDNGKGFSQQFLSRAVNDICTGDSRVVHTTVPLRTCMADNGTGCGQTVLRPSFVSSDEKPMYESHTAAYLQSRQRQVMEQTVVMLKDPSACLHNLKFSKNSFCVERVLHCTTRP